MIKESRSRDRVYKGALQAIKQQYQVIYCDPPWSYRNKRTGANWSSGSASHYPTLSLNEILELPVRQIAEPDSVLFLWATVPLLPEGFAVMKEWGFKYKTAITWRKIMSLGMGYWFRGQTEHLLFGIRGKVPAFRCQSVNFLQAKAGRHSEKPAELRTLIEKVTPSQRRLEMFARTRHQGWDSWGNEL